MTKFVTGELSLQVADSRPISSSWSAAKPAATGDGKMKILVTLAILYAVATGFVNVIEAVELPSANVMTASADVAEQVSR